MLLVLWTSVRPRESKLDGANLGSECRQQGCLLLLHATSLCRACFAVKAKLTLLRGPSDFSGFPRALVAPLSPHQSDPHFDEVSKSSSASRGRPTSKFADLILMLAWRALFAAQSAVGISGVETRSVEGSRACRSTAAEVYQATQ